MERTEATEAMEVRWQGHPLQALVEVFAKTQALQSRWQGHPVQALVKIVAKTQACKAAGEMV
jgi:hypothetical protein